MDQIYLDYPDQEKKFSDKNSLRFLIKVQIK